MKSNNINIIQIKEISFQDYNVNRILSVKKNPKKHNLIKIKAKGQDKKYFLQIPNEKELDLQKNSSENEINEYDYVDEVEIIEDGEDVKIVHLQQLIQICKYFELNDEISNFLMIQQLKFQLISNKFVNYAKEFQNNHKIDILGFIAEEGFQYLQKCIKLLIREDRRDLVIDQIQSAFFRQYLIGPQIFTSIFHPLDLKNLEKKIIDSEANQITKDEQHIFENWCKLLSFKIIQPNPIFNQEFDLKKQDEFLTFIQVQEFLDQTINNLEITQDTLNKYSKDSNNNSTEIRQETVSSENFIFKNSNERNKIVINNKQDTAVTVTATNSNQRNNLMEMSLQVDVSGQIKKAKNVNFDDEDISCKDIEEDTQENNDDESQENNNDRSQDINEDGSQDLNEDGSQENDDDGNQDINEDGSQENNDDGSQDINEDGSQDLNEDGSEENNDDGSQESNDDGSQISYEDDIQIIHNIIRENQSYNHYSKVSKKTFCGIDYDQPPKLIENNENTENKVYVEMRLKSHGKYRLATRSQNLDQIHFLFQKFKYNENSNLNEEHNKIKTEMSNPLNTMAFIFLDMKDFSLNIDYELVDKVFKLNDLANYLKKRQIWYRDSNSLKEYCLNVKKGIFIGEPFHDYLCFRMSCFIYEVLFNIQTDYPCIFSQKSIDYKYYQDDFLIKVNFNEIPIHQIQQEISNYLKIVNSRLKEVGMQLNLNKLQVYVQAGGVQTTFKYQENSQFIECDEFVVMGRDVFKETVIEMDKPIKDYVYKLSYKILSGVNNVMSSEKRISFMQTFAKELTPLEKVVCDKLIGVYLESTRHLSSIVKNKLENFRSLLKKEIDFNPYLVIQSYQYQ